MRYICSLILQSIVVVAVLSLVGCGDPPEDNVVVRSGQVESDLERGTRDANSDGTEARMSESYGLPVESARMSEIADFLRPGVTSSSGAATAVRSASTYPTVRQATSDELHQVGLRINGLIVEQGGLQLLRGDLIAFVNNRPVSIPSQFQEALRNAGDQPVTILVYRNGLPKKIKVHAPASVTPDATLKSEILAEGGPPQGIEPSKPVHESKGEIESGSPKIKGEDTFANFLADTVIQAIDQDEEIQGWVKTSQEEKKNKTKKHQPSSEEKIMASKDQSINGLTDMLEHGDLQTRMEAARAIGEMGLRGKPAVPSLIKALSDKSPGLRWEAAMSMAGISELSDEASLALIKALKQDRNAEVRAAAAYAMGKMIPMSEVFQQVLEALQEARNDPDPTVREQVKVALQFFSQ